MPFSSFMLWRLNHKFTISKIEKDAGEIFKAFITGILQRDRVKIKPLVTEDLYSKIKNRIQQEQFSSKIPPLSARMSESFESKFCFTDRPRLVDLVQIRVQEGKDHTCIKTFFQAAVKFTYKPLSSTISVYNRAGANSKINTSINSNVENAIMENIVFEYCPDLSCGSWRIRDKVFESKQYYIS
jgi:hypothetical protein